MKIGKFNRRIFGRLTPKGRSFVPVIDAIRKWGTRHLGEASDVESAHAIAAE